MNIGQIYKHLTLEDMKPETSLQKKQQKSSTTSSNKLWHQKMFRPWKTEKKHTKKLRFHDSIWSLSKTSTNRETSIAPENRPSEKETIAFQLSIFRCKLFLGFHLWDLHGASLSSPSSGGGGGAAAANGEGGSGGCLWLRRTWGNTCVVYNR